MKPRKCPLCSEKVDIQVLDGIVMMYDHETHQPHEHETILTAGADRCPVCGERGDMTRHLCKR